MTSKIKRMFNALLASMALTLAMGSSVSAVPILWIDDAVGNLGTVDVATGTVKVIGNTGHTLVDIAFDPTGNLYGITFGQLFKIDKTTATTTFIGNLGTSVNSLVFGKDGTLYAANNQLFTVDVLTGAGVIGGKWRIFL